MRHAFAALAVWCVLATPAARAEDAPYLQGLNLELPSQETFLEWPPTDLLQRPYWLPWTSASFARAALFGRPILLVLTVDWNRAAQRTVQETLGDPEVLRAINTGYIAVRVNADLRPDIRERYQTGAWPVIAFLLPNGKPMLSQANDLGKAQPITTSAVSREAMLFLLREGTTYWGKWSDVLMRVGDEWTAREGPEPFLAGALDSASSEVVATWLLANADRVGGGFGAAPKFFVPNVYEYASLRSGRGLAALAEHARFTLDKLVESPLYDRREGGTHRLAATASYGGIEYEKTLEGNVALLREIVFALRASDSARLHAVLEELVRFLSRVLSRPDGGFYLAQMADPHSEDGGGYWRGARDGGAPPIDPHVLSGPCALAGAAMLRAGLLLGDEAAVLAGRRALDLVLERAYSRGRGVAIAIQPAGDWRPYLGPQGDVAFGLLDAYESTGEARYLEAARDIVDSASRNLGDGDSAALRDVLRDSFPLGLLQNSRKPLRPNVRLARAMLRLALHGQGDSYREQARQILACYAGDLSSFGLHATEAALGIEEVLREPLGVRIGGAAGDPLARDLRRTAVNSPWAWTIVGTDEAAPPGAEIRCEGRVTRVGDAESMLRVLREGCSTGGS